MAAVATQLGASSHLFNPNRGLIGLVTGLSTPFGTRGAGANGDLLSGLLALRVAANNWSPFSNDEVVNTMFKSLESAPEHFCDSMASASKARKHNIEPEPEAPHLQLENLLHKSDPCYATCTASGVLMSRFPRPGWLRADLHAMRRKLQGGVTEITAKNQNAE